MAFLIPENLPSRSDVPRGLQSVAGAFRDLLDDESTVWLEGSDEKYLLLFDPSGGLLVIEAPEAGGMGARALDELLSRAARLSSRLPPEIRKRADELAAKVQREARLSGHVSVRGTLALFNVPRSVAHSQGWSDSQLDMVLLQDDFRNDLQKAILRVLAAPRNLILSGVQEKVIRGIIKPELIISGGERNKDLKGQLVFRPPEVAPDDVIRVLDRHQERLAHHLGGGYRVIRGVAGSGKTLVLTYRAKHLSENFSNWSILSLCYNVVLARAIEEMVKGVSNIEVRTVDSFATKILWAKRRWKKPSTDSDWIQRREDAAGVLKSDPKQPHYDVVLVDEAQDLDSAGMELAYSALKPDRDHFVVALDSAQNIYRKQNRWNPPGQSARGRTTLLRINYRNTKEILEFAMRFLMAGNPLNEPSDIVDDPTVIVPPEATSRRGPRPEVIHCSDMGAEAEEIAKRVQDLNAKGVPFGNIAVLYGSREWQRKLYGAMMRRGLPYYWVTMNWKTKNDAMAAGDKVRVSTLQGLKGVEFSRVFLCGVNKIDAGDADEETLRRLVYVGMTRAMDELTITISGSGPIGNAIQRAQE